MEHTNLPWISNPNTPDTGIVRIESRDNHGIDNNGWIVAELFGPDAEANAEYIVRACNAFPLVRDLVEQYAAVLEEGHPLNINKNCNCVVCKQRETIIAALAAGDE